MPTSLDPKFAPPAAVLVVAAAVLWTWACAAAQAGTQPTASPADTTADRPLSLDVFLANVLNQHPLFPAERLDPRLARLARRQLAAAQDWRVDAEAAWRWSEPVTSTPFSPRETESMRLTTALERAFWATGGRLAIDWQASWTDQDLPTITIPGPDGAQTFETGPGTLFRNVVGVRWVQPLWRNRGGLLDRTEWLVAAHRIDVATLEARENQENFLLEVARKYVAWAKWRALRDVTRDRLHVAREQLELVEGMRDASLVDRVDVLRAEAALAATRRALALVEAELQGQRAELAVLARLDLAGRRPAYELTRTFDLPPPAEACAEVRDQARVLRILASRQAAARDRRDAARARTAPGLDLALDLNLKGGGRDAYTDAWDLEHPEAAVSLSFSQAIGASGAEAAHEQSELELRQLEYRRERARLALEASVARQLARLRGLADALALHRRQVSVARDKAAAERDLYREGRNQLQFVLQAQDAVDAARRAWYETAARYHQLLLAYRELTDRLLTDGGGLHVEAVPP